MKGKRITIREVAARAGVSIATVSNVFSGRKAVNDDLQKRVKKAARDLSYEVNRAASQLRSGRARVVGVLVPDLDDVFFTSLVSQLEVLAQRDGYDILVGSSRDDPKLEQSRLRALLGWRPSGLIAVPCTDAIPIGLDKEIGRLPMVFADRVIPNGGAVDTVTIDNREAGEIAARYLIASGRRNIVLAASTLAISPIRDRVQGASELIRAETGRNPIVIELGSNAERGAGVLSQWVERHARPDAVIALTNVTTLSTLSALARLRIDIPDPVAVIGFDDYPWMSARKTALTAIRQPIEDIAEAAWSLLRKRMAGDRAKAQSVILNASLQVRDSVTPARTDAPDETSNIDAPQRIATSEKPSSIH